MRISWLYVHLNQVVLGQSYEYTCARQHHCYCSGIFGWLSVRVLRLPITIGTMLLTVISSVMMICLGRVFPGLHVWAVAWRAVFGLRI